MMIGVIILATVLILSTQPAMRTSATTLLLSALLILTSFSFTSTFFSHMYRQESECVWYLVPININTSS